MTTVSYTKLKRYIENPARAYAHYVKKEEDVYPINNKDALVYGRILHSIMADEDIELSEDEKKIAYKYGKEERGLKATFETIEIVSQSMFNAWGDLYRSLGLKVKAEADTELPFENDSFNGRFDWVDMDNKIIIDWKTVSPRTDFDKAWSDKDSTYTSWIHSTSYDLQAFIYLYSIIELTNKVGWRYYVIAATKEAKPRTRVIDMSGVIQDFALREEVEQALNDIESYEQGTKRPVLLNDKSEWYEEHKPFEVETF